MIVLQVFLTVFSGTLLFVFGQIILRVFVEPWQRQRGHVARVAYVLERYGAQYSNPGYGTPKAQDEAAAELRRCVADLTEGANGIPYYEKLHRLIGLPRKDHLREAQKNLWGLSNTVHDGSVEGLPDRLRVIKNRLGIELWSEEE